LASALITRRVVAARVRPLDCNSNNGPGSSLNRGRLGFHNSAGMKAPHCISSETKRRYAATLLDALTFAKFGFIAPGP